MPAVVRGGRRQSSGKGGARGAPSGRAAEIGRLDMSPRVVAAILVVGVGILAAVLATGARAERIGQSVSGGVDRLTAGMGLTLKRVHVTGASAEAEPAMTVTDPCSSRIARDTASSVAVSSAEVASSRTRTRGSA